MHAHHVAVVWEGFNDHTRPSPLARLVGGGLVLDHHSVANFEGGKLPGADRETLLHFGMSLCMSLLSEVSFQPPLFPGLIFGHEGWQEPLELSTEDDHGRAELRQRVNCVAMLQQGAGKGVCVEGALWAKVAHDKALSSFDSHLGSLVGTRVVSRRDPVRNAPACKEVLNGCRVEDSCPVTGDLLGNAPPCKVLAQHLHDMVGVIFGQLEDAEPVGIPVCNG